MVIDNVYKFNFSTINDNTELSLSKFEGKVILMSSFTHFDPLSYQ